MELDADADSFLHPTLCKQELFGSRVVTMEAGGADGLGGSVRRGGSRAGPPAPRFVERQQGAGRQCLSGRRCAAPAGVTLMMGLLCFNRRTFEVIACQLALPHALSCKAQLLCSSALCQAMRDGQCGADCGQPHVHSKGMTAVAWQPAASWTRNCLRSRLPAELRLLPASTAELT